MAIELSIIVVHYNSAAEIGACLESISAHPPHCRYEIIIFDNASPEPPPGDVIDRIPEARVITVTENRGFGAGNNAGVREAKGEYLFLLNPDTLIIDDSINKMLEFLKKRDEIGALTCFQYDEDQKTLQTFFFGDFQTLTPLIFKRGFKPRIDLSREYVPAEMVTGAALMIKTDVYQKIGGFDEKFFMYFEDDDLCRRLVEAGYQNAVLTAARIVHLGGKSAKSTRQKKLYYYASQNRYWQKHNGAIPTLIMRLLRWPYKLRQTR